MSAKPSKESASATAEHDDSSQESANAEGSAGSSGAAGQNNGDGDENVIAAPPRQNADVLSCVESAGLTIDKCSEAELKNFMATADYLCRELSVMLADKWKEICHTAKLAGEKEGAAAAVALAIGVKIDQTNLSIMDTKVSLAFARKYKCCGEKQEDLRQVDFLKS